MSITKINDAPAVDQTIQNAAKFLALVIWKLAPEKRVVITVDDIEDFAAEGGVLYTHGMTERFELSIVTPEQAARIATHEESRKGHA